MTDLADGSRVKVHLTGLASSVILKEGPVGPGATNANVADYVTGAGATQTALDARYALLSAIAELARDAVGAALVPGSGVTVTVNDGADTITLGFARTVNNQTGTTYTLVLADAEALVTANNASGCTITVPANATVAFPVGTTINFQALHASATLTLAAAGGVTLNSAGAKLKSNGQFTVLAITKTATNTWAVYGDRAL